MSRSVAGLGPAAHLLERPAKIISDLQGVLVIGAEPVTPPRMQVAGQAEGGAGISASEQVPAPAAGQRPIASGIPSSRRQISATAATLDGLGEVAARGRGPLQEQRHRIAARGGRHARVGSRQAPFLAPRHVCGGANKPLTSAPGRIRTRDRLPAASPFACEPAAAISAAADSSATGWAALTCGTTIHLRRHHRDPERDHRPRPRPVA
jgi:hypothetical protein